MKTTRPSKTCHAFVWMLLFCSLVASCPAQILINVNFGAGPSAKTGLAAAGATTNDFWNAYRHYEPRFTPGMPLVTNGKLDKLKLADGTETVVSVAVTNAPGVWGNASSDPMFDTYMFSDNGSNIVVVLHGLTPGSYHFYLYGHADPDVSGEQNSIFSLHCGTNTFGPLTGSGGAGWKSGNGWQERSQYVLFRDITVTADPVVIEAAPGPNGIAVLNGLQVLSRGTGAPKLAARETGAALSGNTNLLFREISYVGQVADREARFQVTFAVESMTTNEIQAPLFEGEVALVSPILPKGLRIISSGSQSRLFCSTPGVNEVKLDLVAKITRKEPWNEIRLSGPAAAIASVSVEADLPGVDMQLLSGTQVSTGGTNESRLRGFLGADRVLGLRWQSKGTEVARKSLVTVDTTATATVTPNVIKYTTAFRYSILQAPVARLAIELPASHALTRIEGEQIRDWQVKTENGEQLLVVDFIKAVEKSCLLTLFSEQATEATSTNAQLLVPRPLGVERESGSLTVLADDTTIEIRSASGLRQVNAPGGALASYRYNARPIGVTAAIQRIEPVVKIADRVSARLEETRLLVTHALHLQVDKAGIYALKLVPQPGFNVTEVTGDGIDDWKAAPKEIRVSFASRVMGERKIKVQLEKASKEVPDQIEIAPLEVEGSTNVTTRLSAASAPGISLKTASFSRMREVPVTTLPDRTDELLAFVSEQPGWTLSLSVERLAARVVAEVFNLVTIGDGLVGGSATVRYGIINQGVQQFRIVVPAHWKNLEFTGANIRRKEQQTNQWLITLQDKAWGGYTLVITYDYQFDPQGAAIDLSGAHTIGSERETGSLGLMTAASLKLTPSAPADPLRRVDEAELSASDRALCTRPLLLAYKYSGTNYQHSAQVTRFEEVAVLEAVADRTELTTVLTEEGQLLTQSSFMVKNNEKQFQRFKLPPGASFWSSFVNGQPAKPERDGEWYLVPLPREADRDQAFAVDIVYAQKLKVGRSLLPNRIELTAPLTDIPNTYAEWQLFAPASHKLGGFGGTMTVASGTTYGLHDAWQQFMGFYGNLIEHHLGKILTLFVTGLFIVLISVALHRGLKGAVTVLLLFGIMAILAAMMLPALSKAKVRAQRISAVNNLKQIGLAAKTWSLDNGDVMPPNFDAMKTELGTEKITIDPKTGQRFVYVGAGKSDNTPEAILAYSPSDTEGRAVLFADGSVQILNQERFDQAMQRDAGLPRVANSLQSRTSSAESDVTVARRFGGAAVAADRMAGLPVQTPSPALKPAAEAALSAATAAARPTVSGVRPIRIDIPRAGQAFSFTKVLNAGSEPLKIQASMMRLKTYRAVQMAKQVTGFLLGLGLLAFFRITGQRKSFWMAAAIALIIWSVTSLLIMWRWMHVFLIMAIPAALGLLIAWGIYRLWKRGQSRRSSPPVPPAQSNQTDPGSANAAGSAAALLLFGISIFSVQSLTAQNAPSSALPNTVSIQSANYSGTIDEKVARLDAVIHLSTTSTNQLVPLFGEDAAVESFQTESSARILRDARGVGILLPAKGDATLQLKLVVKLGGDISRRQLAFAIPPALASEVNLTIAESDAEVEFPSAVAFERKTRNQQTIVQGVLGATGKLEMNWTPRVKRAAEIAATVFVNNTALVTVGGGVVNTRSILDYQISQGELKQLRIQLPPDQRVLSVEGESLRLWEVKDDALVVDLLRGVSPTYKLKVETEKVLEKLPATISLAIPHAQDVKRETGLIGYRGSEELSLTSQRSEELQRIDIDEFKRSFPWVNEPIASAFRFLKPEWELVLRAEAVQPQVEAQVTQQVRIGAESQHLVCQIDYSIKRAGLFGFRLLLPADYRVESVTGTNQSQWIERNAQGDRIMELSLKERTLGSYRLGLVLVRTYKEPSHQVSIPTVHPLGTEKLSGVVSVVTEPGFALKTGSLEGLTEIPYNSASVPVNAEASTSQASALGYKFMTSNPGSTPPWSLAVTVETVEPWVRAEIMNVITLSESLVSGRSVIKYEVVNAPLKEFRIRVPSQFRNVEITGAQIRRRDETNNEWRVELQGKVRGDYFLTVTWELSKASEISHLKLDGIQALGVERETGYVSLVARPPLQVSEQSATDLLSRVDVRELPGWTGKPEAATALAYRYLRPGYQLNVEARRFAEAEVLQALIDSARMTTVVADDGQVITEISLSVRNNGRQHLELDLPAGNKIWSAFVGGDPVRPSKKEGKYLLPLAREVASDAPISIEITFVGTHPFPRHNGKVNLISPTFDVPMKNARWDLYLPPDYEYSEFTGSMARTSEAGAPMVQVYSISEYNEQQRVAKDLQVQEIKSGLNVARENLSGGDLRMAVNSLSRAKAKGVQLETSSSQELKEVAQEVRKAQSSNLISAQNNYFYSNAGRLNGQAGEAWEGRQMFQSAAGYFQNNVDLDVAGLQWDKLEKAQQVSVAKVSPLRVNLPTRGMHYTFSQVLQTETGKPMTISLAAENTKEPSWFRRISLSFLGFAVLWGMVALVNSRQSQHA
jgi:type II secretory pathway pseudopilin PulG